jgi:serine/threonine protein phosphatase PrpC
MGVCAAQPIEKAAPAAEEDLRTPRERVTALTSGYRPADDLFSTPEPAAAADPFAAAPADPFKEPLSPRHPKLEWTPGHISRVGSMCDMIVHDKRMCFGVSALRGSKRGRDELGKDGAHKSTTGALSWRGGGGEDCIACELGCARRPDTPRALRAFAEQHGGGVKASTPDFAFFAVFDGHGGKKQQTDGQKTSSWFSENTYSHILECLGRLEPDARTVAAAVARHEEGGAPSGPDPWLSPEVWSGARGALETACLEVDRRFCNDDEDSVASGGHGSTFAALMVLGPLLIAMGVGDSCVIGSFDGRARSLVERHSVENANEIARCNTIEHLPETFSTFEVARRSPLKLKVTRAFGHYDVKTWGLEEGSKLPPVPPPDLAIASFAAPAVGAGGATGGGGGSRAVLRRMRARSHSMSDASGVADPFAAVKPASSIRKIASSASFLNRVQRGGGAGGWSGPSSSDLAVRKLLEARPSVQIVPRRGGEERSLVDFADSGNATDFQWSTPEFIVIASDGVLDAFGAAPGNGGGGAANAAKLGECSGAQRLVTWVKSKLLVPPDVTSVTPDVQSVTDELISFCSKSKATQDDLSAVILCFPKDSVVSFKTPSSRGGAAPVSAGSGKQLLERNPPLAEAARGVTPAVLAGTEIDCFAAGDAVTERSLAPPR